MLPLRIEQSLPKGNATAPTQTAPSLSSAKPCIKCPASSGYWLSLRSFQLAKPLSVPIQRVPSRDVNKLKITGEGSCSPPGGRQGIARTPSKRNKPVSVPTQRYPSGV